MRARRDPVPVLALVAGLFAGCAQNPPPPPPPEPVAKATPVAEPKPEPVDPPQPGKITLPKDGGRWPWNLAPAPEPAEFRPVAVPDVTEPVTGLVVSTAAKRAVLFQKIASKTKYPDRTRVVLCDTAAGRVLREWDIKDLLVPLDLSPDGRQILAYPQPGLGHNTLVLLIVDETNSMKRLTWHPHGYPDPEGNMLVADDSLDPHTPDPLLDVKWAGFVGNDRLASAANGGQLRVFDTANAKRIASIEAAPCKPTVTPDGTGLLFLTNTGLTLLDPKTCTVVGTRKIGAPAGEKQLAVNPAGKTVACVAPGRVRFMDLATGQLWDSIIPQMTNNNGGIPRNFGWAGNDFLMADGHLYDPDLPCPAWTYGRFDTVVFRGREAWAAVAPEAFSNSKTVTIRPFILPHAGVPEAIAAGRNNPNIFTLQPGDMIRIDVSGIPADERAAVKANLEKRFRVIGYRSDPSGTAVLYASVDTIGRPASAAYIGGTTVQYTHRPARLKLVKDGKQLWAQAWVHEPPFSVLLSGNDTLQSHFDRSGIGSPDYGLFERAPIPPMFPGPQFPSWGFGHHEFAPDGLREWGNGRRFK
ncbi:MAG TPA: hypothetical protein VKE74_21955 [Gemmataceae bacterium]|nr:hypothetical protein [Gemmataceae bacterium]